jgi:glutathionylspermidine synthase
MNLPWHVVAPLEEHPFREVRRAAIFECCKWDPQVEDVCTLSPQPVVLTRAAWNEIAKLAGQLGREIIAAERELLQRPELWAELALPWSFRHRLAESAGLGRFDRHLHLTRFDFHFTTVGWRISEANTDVPGGFNEAAGFTRLMAQHYAGTAAAGDPVQALVDAIANAVGTGATVALLHATAFSDDRQVMVYLARALEGRGLKPVLASPEHLSWQEEHPYLETDWAKGPVDFVFRFFPGEWLPALPRRCAWWHLLGDSKVPLCNPGSALLTQSKRLPLVWDELSEPFFAWHSLLPRTCDPRCMNGWGKDDGRVYKPAFGRVGDMIHIEGVTGAKEARRIARSVRWHPRHWIAQERFHAIPMQNGKDGTYPCIGVYTLNGRVIGAYGRMAPRPLIDHLAQDTAVLVADSGFTGSPRNHSSHDSL